ncbi:MAG: T9SS type A sorting domain-containing protein [Bacteroidota bacterium]
MKKSFLLFVLVLTVSYSYCQVVYSNSFGNLTLQTYTTSGSTTRFYTVPSSFSLINDGLKNNIGSLVNPNRPFHEPGLKTAGWAVVYNQADNDTFLVSTSWLDTTNVAVNRWAITPVINNITANSVLTWLAKSPDSNFPEGYEVYGTTNPGVLTAQDFAIGDRLFALSDGNTFGGGEKNVWTRHSVNIGSFAGQTLRFAFRNNSKDMYQLWIDDIEVINLASSRDAALSTDVPRKYILVNSADSVKFKISNLGAAIINTISVSYQVGNSSLNTENLTISGGIGYGQSTSLKFGLPFTFSSAGFYNVKSWINSVNGQPDQYLPNDTIVYSVTVQNTSPAKNILFEQFVSANNGEGPDAQEKTLALQSSSVIVVNIHDLDSLKENNSAALISDYKKDTPGAMVDRFYFNDLQSVVMERQSYNNHINARAGAVTPVSVSVINKNYNSLTRQLSFTLKADFAGDVKGDYRLNAYLTENYVSGPVADTSINGFNQLNNFFNVPWSPYYQKGYYSFVAGTYVLDYWEFQHKNALVHAFAGAYGNSGVIPSNGGTQGQSYQQTFSLTIPTAGNGVHKFNADNLYIVGFAAEYSSNKNNRNVLNCVKEKLNTNPEFVGISEKTADTGLGIFPNPSTGIFYFNAGQVKNSYVISVFDLFGKCLKIVDVANSRALEPLDLSGFAAGIYVLRINTGSQVFTGKVIIQK